jgi:hypothetical protein
LVRVEKAEEQQKSDQRFSLALGRKQKGKGGGGVNKAHTLEKTIEPFHLAHAHLYESRQERREEES